MEKTIQSLLDVDRQLVATLQKHVANQMLDHIFVFISALGRTPFYIAALLLILIFSWQLSLCLFLLLTLSELLNTLIKETVKRPRPCVRHADIANKDKVESGSSFPSCHTQNTIIFWGYLIVLFQEPVFTLTGLVVVGLTLFSRMYLGLHYLSDIITGAVIGFFILFLGLQQVTILNQF